MAFLTVSEVEEQTGVTATTIRAMLREGLIPGVDEGGRWGIPEGAVEQVVGMADDAEAMLDELDSCDEDESDEDDDDQDDSDDQDDE